MGVFSRRSRLGVTGVIDGDSVVLNGRGSFSSGGRYADWAGVVFAVCDADGNRVEPLDIRFTIVPLSDPNVRIDPTWDGSSVRVSATDDIHYEQVRVPLDRCADSVWCQPCRNAAHRARG